MNTRFVQNVNISLVHDGIRVEFEIPVYPDILRQNLFEMLEKEISNELGLTNPTYELSLYYHDLTNNRQKITMLVVTNQTVNKIYQTLYYAFLNITNQMLEWEALYEYVKMKATAEKGGNNG